MVNPALLNLLSIDQLKEPTLTCLFSSNRQLTDLARMVLNGKKIVDVDVHELAADLDLLRENWQL